MITSYPVPFTPAPPARRAETPPGKTKPPPVAADGSWRYDGRSRGRGMIVIAALLSASVHAGIIFGWTKGEKKAAPPKAERVIALTLAMPKLDELEEPEVAPNDEARPATDLSTLVPMQADLPQIPRPSDFVQQINFTSLIERPDFRNVDLNVIPEHFRGGRQLSESIGKIFNLADLDRTPEPVLQQAPLYPVTLKREGISGVVRVEFIVDSTGRVLDARATETSHSGFDDAAVAAVMKWKFRAGVKAGRKVNTRMAVPIVFTVEEG